MGQAGFSLTTDDGGRGKDAQAVVYGSSFFETGPQTEGTRGSLVVLV
jgi:hypothetical protein